MAVNQKKQAIFGWLLFAAISVIIVSLTIYVVQKQNQPNEDKGPVSSYSIYYPADSINGFVLEKPQSDPSKSATIYQLVNKSTDVSIVISVQPLPPTFEPDTFFIHTRKISVSIGTAYIEDETEFPSAIIIADRTLIILRPTGAISKQTIDEIVRSFHS